MRAVQRPQRQLLSQPLAATAAAAPLPLEEISTPACVSEGSTLTFTH